MNRSKSLAGLLALVLAAAAVVAWGTRKRLTAAWETALGAGDQGLQGVAGRAFGLTAQGADVAAPDSPPAAADSSAMVEDEASRLQPDFVPETAEELAGLLPESDLRTAGLDDDGAGMTDDAAAATASPDATVEQSGTGVESAPVADDAEGVDQVLAVLAAEADEREPSRIESRFGPNAVPADEGGECPPEHPVKGNTNSMIYHLPGESSYGATMAEVCFSDGAAAQEAGFRPRKR